MIVYIAFIVEDDDKFAYPGAPSASAMSKYTSMCLAKTDDCLVYNCKYPISKDTLLSKIQKYWWVNRDIIKTCLNYDRKDLKVVAYHSFLIIPALIFLRAMRYKVILQVNEIYTNVENHKLPILASIEKFYLSSFDYFLCASKLIIEAIELPKKRQIKYAVLPGPIRDTSLDFKSNALKPLDKIAQNLKFVYGGVIDISRKRSVLLSLEFFQNLRYQDQISLDIFGYGAKSDIEFIENLVNKCEHKNIKFMGTLDPVTYAELLSRYDVGLSIDPVDSTYMGTSYPSKILTYLSRGLNVIASNSPALLDNDIDGLVNLISVNDINVNFDFKFLNLYSKKQIKERLEVYEENMLFEIRKLLND